MISRAGIQAVFLKLFWYAYNITNSAERPASMLTP